MKKSDRIEVCVEYMADALYAQRQGATQIELCSRLDLDGLTPGLELVQETLRGVTIPVKVMVRPRGGDFVFSTPEVEMMISSFSALKKMGVQEVVLGAMTKDHEIDLAVTTALVQAAQPMKVTFHKAIDEMKDPVMGVKQLAEIKGITSILTSGGKPTAKKGAEVIQQMVKAAEGKIQIIAAGKITHENLDEIDRLVGADAYHGKLIVGPLR